MLALNLLASTLLMASPLVMGSLATPRAANLPGIGSVVADAVYAPIQPLSLGSSNAVDLSSLGSPAVSSPGYYYLLGVFGDYDFDLSIERSFAGARMYYSDGEFLIDQTIESLTSLDEYDPTIIYVYGDCGDSMTITLPDLSYWSTAPDDIYYLTVLFCHVDGVALQAVYGNVVTGSSMSYTLAELGEDVNPITAIGDGLGVIGELGGALGDGFDAVFMNGTDLTSVGTFSFVLLGLGISVGIVKKCFNWVTGRHGM